MLTYRGITTCSLSNAYVYDVCYTFYLRLWHTFINEDVISGITTLSFQGIKKFAERILKSRFFVFYKLKELFMLFLCDRFEWLRSLRHIICSI